MSHTEQNARRYCMELGLDPNQVVWGYYMNSGLRERIECARWRWYMGAVCSGRNS